MKRFGTILVLLSFTVLAVVASNVTADDVDETTVTHLAYVDADGDGICDNAGSGFGRGTGTPGAHFVDADGDGVCDNAGSGFGRGTGTPGSHFVDADGDGVCDNAGSGFGRGTGTPGANFVDVDGDGVCDNCAARMEQRKGKGRGKAARSSNRAAKKSGK